MVPSCGESRARRRGKCRTIVGERDLIQHIEVTMKTEEPEPIDWSIWGVKTPHEVRMANLQKAHDWEMENQTKVHAAEMARINSPEYLAELTRQADFKAAMAERGAKHEATTKRLRESEKRLMLFDIQHEVDELK